MNPNSSPAAETIASLCRQLDKAHADLAAAQKACAEMRKCFIPVKELDRAIAILEEIAEFDTLEQPCIASDAKVELARLEALKGEK